MQYYFEKNLITVYLPYLIPGLQYAAFGKGEDTFYADRRFNVYPSAEIIRTDVGTSRFYPFYRNDVDDSSPSTGSYICYQQGYTVKVYVEKQQEMLRLRDGMRIRYHRDPYVYLIGYTSELPDMRIGIWLTSMSIESVRSNQDEKGAQRCINFDFHTNLVMSDVDQVPEIDEVIIYGVTPEPQHVPRS